MILFGVHVSEETITSAAFAIIGFLVAINIWIRAKAKRIEANAKVNVADADIRVTQANIELADSETERKKAEAEIKERADLFEMIKGLAEQNKEQTQQGSDFLASLGKIREEKEADYQTLKNIWDTNTQVIIGEVQKVYAGISSQIATLDTTIQLNKREWIETVASEFATVLAAKFQERIIRQEQYPFPAADDTGWVDDFVKPIVNHVYLYSRPHAGEATRSQIEIMTEGENLGLYRGWKKDWIAVRFTRGNKAQFGWIQEHEVRIGVPAVKMATSEIPILPNPILNAT